jgi:hypothetical protein
MASQASPAFYNDLIGKEIFLPRPPPSFDCDFEGDQRSSHDIDENWLPDFKDMISGNFHVMINITGDLDSAVCHYLYTRHDHHRALILVARRITPSLLLDTNNPI